MRSRALRIVLLLMGREQSRSPGKSNSLFPLSSRNISRISMACVASGTMCGLRIFMRSAGMSQRAPSMLISVQRGPYEFTGPHECQRHKLQCQPSYLSPLVDLDVSQQVRKVLRVDPRIVTLAVRLQDVARPDLAGGIPLCVAMGYRIAENLPGCFEGSLRDVSCAASLNRFGHRHQFRCLNLPDSPRT